MPNNIETKVNKIARPNRIVSYLAPFLATLAIASPSIAKTNHNWYKTPDGGAAIAPANSYGGSAMAPANHSPENNKLRAVERNLVERIKKDEKVPVLTEILQPRKAGGNQIEYPVVERIGGKLTAFLVELGPNDIKHGTLSKDTKVVAVPQSEYNLPKADGYRVEDKNLYYFDNHAFAELKLPNGHMANEPVGVKGPDNSTPPRPNEIV